MSRALTFALLAGLVGLGCFSAYLAAHRVYQVDECQYIYMAQVLAAGQQKIFFTDASAFTIPLSWLAKEHSNSVGLFTSSRFVMLGFFWLNIVLITLNTGEMLRSLRGLIALFMAATLAPIWDYGFEIRHDVVLLTALLLIWFILRVRPGGVPAYVITGALTVVMEFVAFKSFAYTLPLSVAFLVFPPASHGASRLRLLLSWIAGALGAILVARLVYGQMGLWQVYLADFQGISSVSAHTARFPPWATLSRLLVQAPPLLAAVIAAFIALIVNLCRQQRAALSWSSNLPEALLFLGTASVLFINPTPFPYNLLQVVPFAFVFSFRYLMDAAKSLTAQPSLFALLASILVFVQSGPFWAATQRHLEHTNTRQLQLMRLAESLTDPQNDPVYDAVGMVPSRPSIGFRWFLHLLNIQSFLNGSGPRVPDLLAARPAAVFIPNYRTDWLSSADHNFIRDKYVSLADDFMVLGKTLPPGGGAFEIYHSGRYRISTVKGSDLQGTYEVSPTDAAVPQDRDFLNAALDGAPLPNRPMQLTVGTHRLECSVCCRPAVVWVGPRLDRVGRIGPGDHQELFYNWY
jgi:hypothetical protein